MFNLVKEFFINKKFFLLINILNRFLLINKFLNFCLLFQIILKI